MHFVPEQMNCMQLQRLNIEVLYIPHDAPPFQIYLPYEESCCVQDVLRRSGVWDRYPETRTYAVGVFSHRVAADTIVKAGDRIEIYRSLVCDPKDQRRRRAVLQKKSKI